MADETRLSQGGLTVAAESDPEVRLSQGGLTVAAEPTHYTRLSQGGLTAAACPVLAVPSDIEAVVDGVDIALAWTNDEDANTLIEHCTDGSSYAELSEVAAGTAEYTHTAPDEDLTHYYRISALDGLCQSDYGYVQATFGKIYAHATSFGNDGEAEVIPVRGDRSAWRVTDYEDDHADDIANDALLRHLPAIAAAGNYARDNGTNWVTQVGLPLTDLNDYARGSIIRGGAADWEAYAAATLRYVLIGDGTDVESRALVEADLPEITRARAMGWMGL